MNKKEAKFLELPADRETVILGGKRFLINQKQPTLEITTKYGTLVSYYNNIGQEIERINSMIDLYGEQLDTAILNKDFESMEKYDDKIKQKRNELLLLSSNICVLIYDVLDWCLGNEAVELIKKAKMSSDDLLSIIHHIAGRNEHLKDVVK